MYKRSFVNDFDIDHGILTSLTLLEHKLCMSRKIHKCGGFVVSDCINILTVKSENYVVLVKSSTLEDHYLCYLQVSIIYSSRDQNITLLIVH